MAFNIGELPNIVFMFPMCVFDYVERRSMRDNLTPYVIERESYDWGNFADN